MPILSIENVPITEYEPALMTDLIGSLQGMHLAYPLERVMFDPLPNTNPQEFYFRAWFTDALQFTTQFRIDAGGQVAVAGTSINGFFPLAKLPPLLQLRTTLLRLVPSPATAVRVDVTF